MSLRIKPEAAALADAATALRQVRQKYPAIREVVVMLDLKDDRIKSLLLSKFTEKYADLVQEQAAQLAKKRAIRAKKEAEIAAAKIKWQKQQDEAAARALEQEDDGEDADTDGEDHRETGLREKRKRVRVRDEERKRLKAQQQENQVAIRTVVPAKRNAKRNPSSGYDPRQHIARVQDKPSPTKLNKVLGAEVLAKSGPSFKIPKKNDKKYYPPSTSAPDCPSFDDDVLESTVYDPLAEILGAQEKAKKPVRREVREAVCRSPERPARPVPIVDHDDTIENIINMLEKEDADGGQEISIPDSHLGSGDGFDHISLYPAAENPDDPDAGRGDDAMDTSPVVSHVLNGEVHDEDEPPDDQEMGADDSEPEAEPEPGPSAKDDSMLVDHDELDYGDDDEDGDDDDDEDDGNFKRGRRSSASVPAKRQPAVGIVALLPPQKRSAPPATATRSGPSSNTVIRAPAALPAPPGRKTVIHDDVEQDVEADAKAKRAARFAETKQIYNSKTTSKIPIATDKPSSTAPPPAPVTITAPAAPVIRKGLTSKVALLKDPPPRSFSPDPDVEPDITPVIRPKTRRPVQIVNSAALLNAGDEVDLFAPPEKVPEPVPPEEPVIVPPAIPATHEPEPLLTVAAPAAEEPVTPVVRTDPRLRRDPRLSSRPVVAPVPDVVVNATETIPEPHPVEHAYPPVSPPAVEPDPEPEVLVESLVQSHHPVPVRAPHQVPLPPQSLAPMDTIPLVTKPRPAPAEESPFHELDVGKTRKDFSLILAERSKPYFKSSYDDLPPDDIPFSIMSAITVPDPRIAIQPETSDPRLNDDSDDDSLPIFGQQDEPEPVAPVAQAEKAKTASPDDGFKIPVGLAPRSKNKKKISTMTTKRSMLIKRLKMNMSNRPVIRDRFRPEAKPAALLRKGPENMKAQPNLLVFEIVEVRKTMKPKKTMWERIREAQERDDAEEDRLVNQGSGIRRTVQ